MALSGYYIDDETYTDKIWVTNYDDELKDEQDYRWSEMSLKLPIAEDNVAVVAFGAVLIVLFVVCDSALYVLDLGVDEDEYEWVPAILDPQLLRNDKVHSLMVTISNELHFISPQEYCHIHYKSKLVKVLPPKIWKKYCGF